jgi:hypothetical protein
MGAFETIISDLLVTISRAYNCTRNRFAGSYYFKILYAKIEKQFPNEARILTFKPAVPALYISHLSIATYFEKLNAKTVTIISLSYVGKSPRILN